MDEQGRESRTAWEAEMFRLLAENVKDYAIFIVDPHRHVLSWNKGAERLLGFSEAEIVGQPCDRFFTPEDTERGVPQRELDEALRTGRGDDDRWHLRKDGRRFWASGTVTPLRGEGGTLWGFAKIMRDRTELKLAEEAARERERQLHLLTDQAPVLIAHCDSDRRYKFVNKPYAARFSLHPREVVGRRIGDVLGEKAYAAIEPHVVAALAGERVEFEVEIPYDGQGPQVMQCAYDPEFDDNGRVRGFVAAIVNVTESRRAEAALAASRCRLQALYDNTLDAILLADDRGHYVDANPAACHLLGYGRDELLRRTVLDITPPSDTGAGRAAWEAFLRDGKQSGEYEVSRKDGSGAVVEFRAVANVLPGLHLAVLRDVSERRRTEEALRGSERRFRTLATHAPVGIFQTDPDGNCVFVNDRWCQITGLTPQGAAGGGWVRALHPEDRGRVRDEWYATAESGREFNAEYRFRTPQGRTAWVHGRAVALRDESGAITGHLGTVIDTTEQKRATDALRESEARLRTLSDNLPLGAVYQVLGDPEGRRRFLYISAGVERMFGITIAEAMADATALYGLVHEEDRPRVAEQEEVAVRDLAPFDCEFRSHTRSGGLVWVHARSAPRPLPTGQVVWEGIISDVTARKQSEADLARLTAESERRRRLYEAALSNTPDLVYVFGLDHRFTYANEGLLRMWGMTWDEAIGKNCLELGYEPWHAAMHDREIEQVVATKQPVKGEVPFTGTFGRRDYEYIFVPVFGEGGEVEAVAGTTRDVTERRRAEQTIRSLLRISERLNSSLDVDALLDVLVQEAIRLVDAESGVAGLHTPEGMVCKRYFQKGTVLPLEYCWPPFHGLPGWLIVHKTPYLTNDALSDAQIVHELCIQFGVRSALSTPILNAAGEVLGFFEVHNRRAASGFDSTDQEMLLAVSQTAAVAIQNALAYRSVIRAEEALKDADRRKDEFLATLAHELRNPLAPLRNGLQVMKLASGNAEAVEQARAMMDRQLGQMVHLIDDLLDVSRITRGKLELRRGRVDLASVIQSAVEGSRPLIEASAHRLSVALPPEPVLLDADPTRLAQVLSNLLTNAAKYTDTAGRIWLTAERQAGEVVVAVKDTGIGIAAEHLPRLFEMFSQVNSALERSQGGLGIGLSLVKGLVEMHGGRVEARSEGLGKGSEFIVRLPVADAPTPHEMHSPASGEKAPVKTRRRILVADDNRDAADSLAMMLRLGGHEVHAVHDGQEAVEAAAWFRADVALLDLGMPRLNGFEACRRIREQPWGRGVVLVAVTGWGQEGDRRRAAEAGFDHHLTKPVNPAALERLLGSVPDPAERRGHETDPAADRGRGADG